MTKNLADRVTKIIGLYQIAGGVIGIGIGLYALFFHFRINIFFILYDLLTLSLFSFCLYSGIKCFKDKTYGLTLTFYNQILQLVFFTFFGFTYMFNAGFGLYFGVDISKGIQFVYQFRLPYYRFGKSDPDRMVLLINAIPIFIALLIDPLKTKLK